MWNGSMRPDEAAWIRKRDIVWASAEAAGRNPADIEINLTVERALPENDAESEALVEHLARLAEIGVQHFTMDFGNPQSTEPIHRFVEQVMAPLRG
jgi:hypothetical protein